MTMPFVLVDYAPFYFSSIAGTAVPRELTGKFVQLRNGTTMYLVLSPRELTKYHAQIVERFCMDKGIEGSFDAKGERFLLHDRAWEVLGGGKFDRDDNNKTIKFYDNSMAYGKFDGNGLEQALAALTDYAGHTIIIE
jgi:hypothetical protein